ncbi:MAG: serine hydrolase [Luteitalea sp.]|nr:serine hydrolase [Luteitalea sp.]
MPRILGRAPSVIVVLILVFPGCVPGHDERQPERQQPDDATIRDILAKRVDAKQSVGITVGIHNLQTSRFISFGTFNGPGTSAVSEETIFEIGSITKTFTATVLADMVSRGEVALDDAVARYLPPQVRLPSRNGKQITLLDLATHTSGLPAFPANMEPADSGNPFADYTQQQLYAFLSSHELARDPGEQYQYSNLGMALLGHVLARRTGMTYEALVLERVLRPLDMNDTWIALTPALRLRFAPGHDASLTLQKSWDMPALAGSGAFRSTARDMMKFLSAYSRPAGTSLERVAPLALEPRRPAEDASVSVGLGWHIVERNGRRFAGVNGQTGCYAAFAGFSMSSGTHVVVLSNSARSVDDIGWHLIDPSIPVQTSFVAERTEIVLEPSGLDRFVGRYNLSPTDVIIITRNGDSLWARISGLDYQLFAEGRQRFFIKAVDAQLAFNVDGSGNTTGLTLRYDGRKFTAQKRP